MRRKRLSKREREWARDVFASLAHRSEEEEMNKNEAPRRVSDVIAGGTWRDVPPIQLEAIAGVDVIILDAHRATVNSEFDPSGQHEAFFVLLEDIAGEQYQLLVSQKVLMDKLGRLVDGDLLPITGCFQKQGKYWNLT